jgi:hypothetical protein
MHYVSNISLLLPHSISKPQPFSAMDLVYERAFGGIDKEFGGFCKQNLIGYGFFSKKFAKTLDGAPLPNLEDPNYLIRSWKDHPRPVGFGFYGRAWMPRTGFLGTYDDKWRKERSPDPPEDFRFDYYNGAHPDLQFDGYLVGNEEVELVYLMPEGTIRFQLPGISISCSVSKSFELLNPESFPEPEEQGRDVEGVEDEDMYEGFEKEDTYEEFQKNQEPDLVDKEVNLNIDTLCLIPDAATVSPPSNGVYLSGLNASKYKAASSGADH